MCGIAGVLGAPVARHTLQAMTDALAHRGPDGQRIWINAEAGIGLGHRRLAIVDLSDAALQPMADNSGTLQLVYNGEIYNHVELRAELSDYPFRTRSDSEVILAAYRRWGTDCVARFNGMFAFAIWDGVRRELFCARDRLGVKPFFYAERDGQLMFASEVKGLLAGGIAPEPDMQSWARYLVHGAYEDQDASFFAGVRALPPGHGMTVVPGGKPRVARYWDLGARAGEALELDLDTAAGKLAALFDDATRLRLRSDVPVALNLSGGVDSSSVAQSFLRQAERTETLHIFTACFDDARYDEDAYADQVVAGHDCVRHKVRLTAPEVPGLATEAMVAQEGPYGGIATLAYHLMHREIRSHGLKVALEGQGGDELFAGYAYFAPLRLLDLMERERCGAARAFLSPYADRRLVITQAHRLRDAKGPLYQDGSEFLAPDCIAEALRAEPAPEPRMPFENRLDNALYRDLTETKLPRVLRMNDRLAMAFGVELRQPFLDWRLVEFAFRLPAELKLAGGMGKHVLRHAMKRHLPAEIVWTPKRPVVTPQREWVAGHLKDWIGDTIASRRFAERGLFEADPVRRTFDDFLAGRRDNAFPVWQWLNADLWFRTFVEGAAATSRSRASS